MNTVNEGTELNTSIIFKRLTNVKSMECIFSTVLSSKTVNGLMKQISLSDMIPLSEAWEAANKEEEECYYINDIVEQLKKVRPLKQRRSFLFKEEL